MNYTGFSLWSEANDRGCRHMTIPDLDKGKIFAVNVRKLSRFTVQGTAVDTKSIEDSADWAIIKEKR